ncbi:MAG: hypothetical protein KDB04_15720 [Acidimicrobiales bacterium]|nr:hypothetical protein [Acidimicrobiales bacterium]MCB1041065.1 hypothetical protein [Acidimicrobiales bacterium]HRW38920.1 hypothetical protein [Aquihabitans sp.]
MAGPEIEAPKGDRTSDDPMLRIEWQLNAMRQALNFLAIVTAIGILLGMVGILAG